MLYDEADVKTLMASCKDKTREGRVRYLREYLSGVQSKIHEFEEASKIAMASRSNKAYREYEEEYLDKMDEFAEISFCSKDIISLLDWLEL